MRRAMQGVAVVVLMAIAFFLGRWSVGAQSDDDAGSMARVTADSPDVAADVPASATTSKSGAMTNPLASEARLPPASPPSPPRAATAVAADIPVSAEATGPQPITQEDEAAFARAETRMRGEGGTTRDLLDLADKEKQDAQARQLEALIGESILRHGGRYTALRVSAPRCTRSVCVVRAISAGTTQDPRADWQRLSLAVMNEP